MAISHILVYMCSARLQCHKFVIMPLKEHPNAIQKRRKHLLLYYVMQYENVIWQHFVWEMWHLRMKLWSSIFSWLSPIIIKKRTLSPIENHSCKCSKFPVPLFTFHFYVFPFLMVLWAKKGPGAPYPWLLLWTFMCALLGHAGEGM